MERLKHLKDTLMCCVEGQMGHLGTVDTQELGAAIDMIKDLEEAIYYCTITKAMGEQDEEMKMMKHKKMKGNGYENGEQYYSEMMYPEMYYPPYEYPRQYANGNGGNSSTSGNGNGGHSGGNGNGGMNGGGRQYYADGNNNYGNPRDNEKEGRSGRSRRQYMEGKEMHHDTATQMRELEKYMKELSSDIIEMIEEASPEERQFLSKKIATLATKVDQVD